MTSINFIRAFLQFLFSSLFAVSLLAQTTLVPQGAVWNYYDQGNEPADQASLDWNDSNYDASGWPVGNAHLGYGDGDESTVINNATLTCYVRHTFSVVDPTNFGSLDLQLTYDDGAVIYLNGTEVLRVNMPAGTISYGTFSATTSSENAINNSTIANALVPGTNVLAVEIHQRSSSSSDISFDCQLTGVPQGVVNVARGPYLQQPTSSSIIVKWRTSTPTESVVHYGTTQGNLSSMASNLTPKTNHELTISGLSPDTKYYYDVANSTNVLIDGASDLFFRTAPVIGTVQPVRAWILGDCGTANNNQRAVRDAYNAYVGADQTDMILFLGDNAYNSGTDSEYQFAIFENMYEDNLKNTVAWSCLGNHDGYSANSGAQSGPYYDIFTFPKNGESGGMSSGTEAYYSFDHGNVHFISMDSYDSDRSVGGAMYNWCESDLQNTTADWIVAFWHHPPYSKGSHNSDSESNLIQMRANFLPLLELYGVDLVLSGHSHSYERSYFLNGHYGSSSTFNTANHTIGTNGDGDGKLDGDGAYEKTTSGAAAGDGAVYITAGSSGKITAANLNHNAMYYSVAELGSCVLEVNGDTMNVKFVRETEAIEDYFTIIKPVSNCTPGATCDDGEACTTGDVYDSNCNCIGTFQDADGDGVCDAEDQCPTMDDNLIGMPCDDGEACTTGDVYDSNCNCAGTFQDADGDGVCDAEDQCPTMDDSLIGMPCDDGEACTTGDVYDNTCQCVGSYIDADNDGYCIGNDPDDNDPCNPDANVPECDPCSEISNESFESNFGIWSSGGNDCARSTSNANTGVYSVRLRDNSGASSSLTSSSLNLDGVSEVIFEFSFYAKSMENNEDFFLEISTNGGNNYSIYQEWNSGIEFANNTRYNESLTISYAFTNNTRFRIRCDASANNDQVYIDDIVIKACNISCNDGDPCDDGDPCTTDDVYDANCDCAGTFQDSDGDGVCDADDQCAGLDDNMIGTTCNDGQSCTTGDVYDNNCQCAGTYTDADNDGYCVGEDPDDGDACNPDLNAPGCGNCPDIIVDGFESNFGNWIDGGTDCSRSTSNANTGSYSIKLRDNSGQASSIYSQVLNLSNYSTVTVDFSFYTTSMENNEDFILEVSTNGGSAYTVIQSWASGSDFSNNTRYNESVEINYAFTSNTRFRLRCDASANNDVVYLDDVIISGCSNGALQSDHNGISETFLNHANISTGDEQLSESLNQKGITFFPNPANNLLYISFSDNYSPTVFVKLYNLQGLEVAGISLNKDHQNIVSLPIRHLPVGLYLLDIRLDDQTHETHKLIIAR